MCAIKVNKSDHHYIMVIIFNRGSYEMTRKTTQITHPLNCVSGPQLLS